MKIKKLLQESFTTSYPVEMVSRDHVQFTTDSGNTYSFKINTLRAGLANKKMIEQKFGIQTNTSDLMGFDFYFSLYGEDGYSTKYQMSDPVEENSPLKIFSTVMKLLERYASASDPDFITFEGEEGLGRLYRRMAQRFIQGYQEQYTVVWSEEDNLTKFLVIKKDLIS